MRYEIACVFGMLLVSACGDYRECEFVGEYRCDGNTVVGCWKTNGRDRPFGTELSEVDRCDELGMVCREGSTAIHNGAWCTDPQFECPRSQQYQCHENHRMECTAEGPVYVATCSENSPHCVAATNGVGGVCAYLPDPCEDGQTRCAKNGVLECENGAWSTGYVCESSECITTEEEQALCVYDDGPCAPEGLRRCDEDDPHYLLTCQEGYWSVGEYLCYETGYGLSEPFCFETAEQVFACLFREGECQDGEQTCDGDTALLSCQGGLWAEQERCPEETVCVESTPLHAECE